MRLSTLFVAIAARAFLVCAHPGGDHEQELARRREYLRHNKADLGHCTQKLLARGVAKRSIQRRGEIVQRLQKNIGLTNPADYSIAVTDFSTNASCVLAPEEIVGPYYVAGEYVRRNVVEQQKGVPLTLDIQFIDVSTCNPVADSYVEIWSANATGVYGGVLADENGSGQADPGNVDNTWLRGVQQTDSDGVVQFETIFPGHYAGRTNHVHVLAHPDAQPLPNGTVFSTTASYVGQLYFAQDLIYSAEKQAPYTENQQQWVTNDQDGILQQDLEQGGNPIVDYKLVGKDVSDGIMAWLAYGVNVANREEVQPAHTYHPKPT